MSSDVQSEAVRTTRRPEFYQRQYIVDKPFQHRLIGTLLGVWLANTIFFSLVLYFFYEGHLKVFYNLVPREGMLPLLTLPALFGLAIAFVALFGLIVTGIVSLYVSNQIAGPLFRMKKYLAGVGMGEWSRTLKFRQNDFLGDMPSVFNGMCSDLRAVAEWERGELEKIEREADPTRIKEIARALREAKERNLGVGGEEATDRASDVELSAAVH